MVVIVGSLGVAVCVLCFDPYIYIPLLLLYGIDPNCYAKLIGKNILDESTRQE